MAGHGRGDEAVMTVGELPYYLAVDRVIASSLSPLGVYIPSTPTLITLYRQHPQPHLS